MENILKIENKEKYKEFTNHYIELLKSKNDLKIREYELLLKLRDDYAKEKEWINGDGTPNRKAVKKPYLEFIFKVAENAETAKGSLDGFEEDLVEFYSYLERIIIFHDENKIKNSFETITLKKDIKSLVDILEYVSDFNNGVMDNELVRSIVSCRVSVKEYAGKSGLLGQLEDKYSVFFTKDERKVLKEYCQLIANADYEKSLNEVKKANNESVSSKSEVSDNVYQQLVETLIKILNSN